MDSYVLLDEYIEELKTTGLYFQMSYNDYSGRILLKNALHSHSFYEIVYIIDGACVQNINNESRNCVSGDLTVLLPGDWHYFESSKENTAVLCLSVSERIMKHFIGLSDIFYSTFHSDNINRVVKLNSSQQSIMSSISSSIYTTFNDSKMQQEKTKILLLNIIQFFSLNNMVDASKTSKDATISHFNNALLQMSIPENIKEGMPALIKLTNFSHSHLCRIFKEKYNMTPHQYIFNLKMEYAYELIINTELSFDEIAEKIGYSSFSHFNKSVTKYYNKTPHAIRKARKTPPLPNQ